MERDSGFFTNPESNSFSGNEWAEAHTENTAELSENEAEYQNFVFDKKVARSEKSSHDAEITRDQNQELQILISHHIADLVKLHHSRDLAGLEGMARTIHSLGELPFLSEKIRPLFRDCYYFCRSGRTESALVILQKILSQTIDTVNTYQSYLRSVRHPSEVNREIKARENRLKNIYLTLNDPATDTSAHKSLISRAHQLNQEIAREKKQIVETFYFPLTPDFSYYTTTVTPAAIETKQSYLNRLRSIPNPDFTQRYEMDVIAHEIEELKTHLNKIRAKPELAPTVPGIHRPIPKINRPASPTANTVDIRFD